MPQHARSARVARRRRPIAVEKTKVFVVLDGLFLAARRIIHVQSRNSAFTSPGVTISVTVSNSSSILNGDSGVLANGAQAFLVLAKSTVISNQTGLSALQGGSIISYQDNQLSGNASDGAPRRRSA